MRELQRQNCSVRIAVKSEGILFAGTLPDSLVGDSVVE